MDGHQCNPVRRILVIFHIHRTQQGHIFKIVRQSDYSKVVICHLGIIPNGPFCLHLLKHLCVALVIESAHTVEEFLHVGCSGLSLNGSIRTIHLQKSRIDCDSRGDSDGRFPSCPDCKFVNHFAEGPNLVNCSLFQSELLQILRISGPEKGYVRSSRGCHQCSQGRFTDTSRWFVHNSFEGLVIVDICYKLEISHHILDLNPVEERIARINHIWKISLPKGLLYRPGLRVGPVENCKVLILSRILMDMRNNFIGNHHGFLCFSICFEQPDAPPLLSF